MCLFLRPPVHSVLLFPVCDELCCQQRCKVKAKMIEVWKTHECMAYEANEMFGAHFFTFLIKQLDILACN